MYKNRNFGVTPIHHRKFRDGVFVTLPIDSFPVSDDSLFNSSGWPMSTLGIIDRFSREHVDEDLLKKIAVRCEELSHGDSNKNLTDDERLMLLRPAWVQTATEFADYQERIYQLRASLTTSSVEVDKVEEKVDVSPADSSSVVE